MFYLFYGEDDFTAKESLARIKADCGGAELGEANATIFDGSKVSYEELAAACNTISFLAPKRLVIVEGLLNRFEKKEKRGKGKGKSPELKQWEGLATLVMPDTTVLVLIDGKLSKTNPLLKKLAPVAEVKECVPLSPGGKELPNWIRARARANGCDISPKALRLMIDLIGNNLWILSNEIDKLCLHASDKRIDEKDINLLVSYARESNVFHMVDAIVQGRLEVASRLAHQLLNEGAAPPYLLFMITRQFRLLVQAKSMMIRKMPSGMIGKSLGLNSDFILGKTLDQCRGYSAKRLEETYRKLLNTDLSIKTGLVEGELALDVLIADLCK